MKSTILFLLLCLPIQIGLAYSIESSISSAPYLILISSTSLFFSLFILFGVHYLRKAIAGRPQAFVYTFMAYSGLKLFSSALLILGIGLGFRELLVELALFILCQYFLYTGFEIVHLRNLLVKSEKK